MASGCWTPRRRERSPCRVNPGATPGFVVYALCLVKTMQMADSHRDITGSANQSWKASHNCVTPSLHAGSTESKVSTALAFHLSSLPSW